MCSQNQGYCLGVFTKKTSLNVESWTWMFLLLLRPNVNIINM